MSKLLDAIRRDPDAVYEVDMTLPSGNAMRATLGPMFNGRLVVQVRFAAGVGPASAEDIAHAKRVVDDLMGRPADWAAHGLTRAGAAAMRRRIMGGGVG